MCLVVHRDTQKKIAKEDITVYKELIYLSEYQVGAYYQDFEYVLNTFYKTEIKESEEQYHTCYDELDAQTLSLAYEDWTRNKDLVSYAQGFHSAISQDRFKECWREDAYIYECVIPKGSEYYENLSGLIVSNQIIIKLEFPILLSFILSFVH